MWSRHLIFIREIHKRDLKERFIPVAEVQGLEAALRVVQDRLVLGRDGRVLQLAGLQEVHARLGPPTRQLGFLFMGPSWAVAAHPLVVATAVHGAAGGLARGRRGVRGGAVL